MNKGLVLVAILAMSIFLTGCGSTQSIGKTFIGGTEGLKVSFQDGTPPAIITDGPSAGQFTIVVKAQNVGEATVKKGDLYVQISGIDGPTYSLDTTKYPGFKSFNTNDIRGAVKNFDGTVLNGGLDNIEFGTLKYQDTVAGDQQPRVWADVCYKYYTNVSTLICVNNNIEQALTNKDICTLEGEKNPQNSGGPIQVTSLKESYGGSGKISVTLTLTHSGSGDNFFKVTDAAPVCNNVPGNMDAGKVKVTFKDVRIGSKIVKVECSNLDSEGYARLYADGSGKATINLQCTIDTTGSNNVVEVPLETQLSYVYLQHVSADLTLRHVPS